MTSSTTSFSLQLYIIHRHVINIYTALTWFLDSHLLYYLDATTYDSYDNSLKGESLHCSVSTSENNRGPILFSLFNNKKNWLYVTVLHSPAPYSITLYDPCVFMTYDISFIVSLTPIRYGVCNFMCEEGLVFRNNLTLQTT